MTRVPSPGSDIFLTLAQANVEELRLLDVQLQQARSVKEIERISSQMQATVQKIHKPGKQWADQELSRVFREAHGLNNSGPLGSRNAARSRRIRQRASRGLDQAQIDLRGWVNSRADASRVGNAERVIRQNLKTARAAKDAAKVSELEGQLAQIRKIQVVETDPVVLFRDKKGRIVSRQPAERYYELAVQGGYGKATNLGFLSGLPDDAYVIVSDGSDCGLTNHRDDFKPNGKIIKKIEAEKWPLAHPFCQRTFTLAEGPPGGRKVQRQLRDLFGTARSRDIARLARAGPVLRQAFDTASALASSPITQRMLRQIATDSPGDLPQFAIRALKRWEGGWAQRQTGYARSSGVAGLSDEALRGVISNDIRETFSNPDFLSLRNSDVVALDARFQKLLGVEASGSKRQVLEALEEFGDYTAHVRAETASQYSKLLDARLHAQALDEVGMAAMRADMSAPRGASLFRKANRAYRSALTAWRAEPGRAGVDVVRSVAGSLERLPWPRVRKGPFQFSVGISAEGRRDLAEAIYVKMRSSLRYNKPEVQWARSLGIDLGQRTITQRDLIRAMLPRFTAFEGNLMNYTIGLENGKLVPIFRLHPQSSYLRHVGLRHRLKSKPIEEYLSQIRGDMRIGRTLASLEGPLGQPNVAGVIEVLKGLGEDSIWTIDAFRQGPIRSSLRLSGKHLESFAIHTGADREWLQTVWRVYARDMVYRFDDASHRTGVYKRLRTVSGFKPKTSRALVTIANLPSRYGARVVGPRVTGTTFFNGKERNVVETLLRLYAWHGDMLEAARGARVDFGKALQIYADFAQDFADTLEAFSRSTAQVFSLEDISIVRNQLNQSRRNMRHNRYLREFEELHGGQADAELFYRNRLEIPDHLNMPDVFKKDVDDFYKAWSQIMPDEAPPQIFVDDSMTARGKIDPNSLGVTYHQENTIGIRPQVGFTWGKDFTQLMARLEETGYTVSGGGRPISLLWHESGHHLASKIPVSSYKNMWRALLEELDIPVDDPKFFSTIHDPKTSTHGPRRVMDRKAWELLLEVGLEEDLMKEVGVYATSAPHELLAELFNEYMVSHNPSRLATIVGNFFTGRRIK